MFYPPVALCLGSVGGGRVSLDLLDLGLRGAACHLTPFPIFDCIQGVGAWGHAAPRRHVFMPVMQPFLFLCCWGYGVHLTPHDGPARSPLSAAFTWRWRGPAHKPWVYITGTSHNFKLHTAFLIQHLLLYIGNIFGGSSTFYFSLHAHLFCCLVFVFVVFWWYVNTQWLHICSSYSIPSLHWSIFCAFFDSPNTLI